MNKDTCFLKIKYDNLICRDSFDLIHRNDKKRNSHLFFPSLLNCENTYCEDVIKLGAKIIDKNCRQCNELMESITVYTQLCDNCKLLNQKENCKKISKIELEKCTLEDYRDNFFKVTKENYTLTKIGFDKVSPIKMNAYRKYFKTSWCDIIKMYGRIDDLFDYIKNEYEKYVIETGLQNISAFGQKYHPFITCDLLYWLGTDKIMSACDIKKMRYTEKEFYNNFVNIKNIFNRIPLFNEFIENTNIGYYTYMNFLDRKEISKEYDSIVEMYASESEYKEYLLNKKKHKTKVGKATGVLSQEYSDKDLKDEFTKIFDFCFSEYGEYPSRRIFNKISKMNDRTFRKRLKLSWLNVCKFYDYNVDKSWKSEKMVLESIKKILGINYIPQHTFDWLIGINNYPLFCDGFFPNLNLVIEFDGRQHREPVDRFGGDKRFLVTQKNDKLKDELIQQNGIKMIRISSDDPWYDSEYLKNKLFENGVI